MQEGPIMRLSSTVRSLVVAITASAVVAFLAMSATAAPYAAYTDIRIAGTGVGSIPVSHSATVNAGDVVSLDLYLLVLNPGSGFIDWGVFTGDMAGTGALQGDLTFDPVVPAVGGQPAWGPGANPSGFMANEGDQSGAGISGAYFEALGYSYSTADGPDIQIGDDWYRQFRLASNMQFTVTVGQSGNLSTLVAASTSLDEDSIQFTTGGTQVSTTGADSQIGNLGTTLLLPEPATLALMGLGVGAALARRRAKK